MSLPDMLLLHDLEDSPRTWDLFAPLHRDVYHVYAPELRGHGESDRPPGAEYRFDRLFSDLLAFVAETGLKDAVVIGHGAGARLAARLAADAPAAVSALVIYELESTEPHSETGWASFDELLNYLRRQRPGATRAVLDRQGRSLTSGGLDGGRSFKHDTSVHAAYMAGALWDDWSAVRCPTLVLRGRLSRDLPHHMAVKLAEAGARSRLAELEDAGHWLHHERPGSFDETVRWFLQSPPR